MKLWMPELGLAGVKTTEAMAKPVDSTAGLRPLIMRSVGIRINIDKIPAAIDHPISAHALEFEVEDPVVPPVEHAYDEGALFSPMRNLEGEQPTAPTATLTLSLADVFLPGDRADQPVSDNFHHPPPPGDEGIDNTQGYLHNPEHMHIDSYSFGHMVVDGKSYDHDVILHPGGIRANWFRREGHELCLGDIREELKPGVTKLIMGTGSSGMVRILPEIKDFCSNSGIELVAQPTAEAVKTFNEADHTSTVGAFHLTC